MGLKLTVKKGDKIEIGNDVVLIVRTTSDNQTQLEFEAPREIGIYTIFKDPSKQFKNQRFNR